jgi:hypothetical protein
MLSPKPGHMNSPFSFMRNQLTQKMRGRADPRRPIFSQWLK